MQKRGDVESVRDVDIEAFLLLDGLDGIDGGAGTFDQQLVVTLLVNGVIAFLALIPLHTETPEKFVTKRAEGRLLEKLGDEFVALERMDLRGGGKKGV